MKKNDILLLGILFVCCIGFLFIYDIKNPKISVRNQQYTIRFDTSEEVDRATILMALPTRMLTGRTESEIKYQIQKHTPPIEGKKIGKNTFVFQLPVKSEKYICFSGEEYDEFATSIIIYLKSTIGTCSLNIARNKYEYTIPRENIKLCENGDCDRESTTNDMSPPP